MQTARIVLPPVIAVPPFANNTKKKRFASDAHKPAEKAQ